MRSTVVFLLASMLSLPLLAQSNEISLLGGTARVGSTDSAGSTVRFDSGIAYGVAYNRFWMRGFSTEFSAMRSSHDGSIRFEGQPVLDTGSLDLTILAATAQYHVIHTTPLDVFAGAGVANVSADDLTSADLRLADISNVHVGTRSTWLLNAGAAIGIGRSFAVGLDARYIRYRPSSAAPGGEPVRLDLDPLIVSAMLKFRF